MSQYNVFTDGSKMNKKVGAGFQIKKENKILLEKAVVGVSLFSRLSLDLTAIVI